MLKSCQILFRSIVLGAIAVVLWGCGQRGPLYLPTDAAAANRATLPQTLDPTRRSRTDTETPDSAPLTTEQTPANPASNTQR
ncbi:LPS translocon maturation chaperone LptM [Diaphorobacter aerolatus]|uniref:Lipoprotein n=1 Tax=Diaphorobacter aerolatus TaxID=1288495 RepID=A0A7H0GNI6_9BURK|nr:lipoprotein [Diaphorobacter aerolatus]QNP49852.1 lipoprotein [Diaphorobacter aerolatus]